MKRQIITISLLIILVLIPIISWLFWYIKPDQTLRVAILDKTVLNKETQEHISLSWVLEHEKYVKADQEYYDHKLDYFGFFPDEEGGYEINDFNNYSDSQLDSIADNYDMIAYTDLYGIYVAEWWDAYPERAPEEWEYVNPIERSRLMYGSMTQKEVDLLKKMKKRKKLIFTEFNIFAQPTSHSVRKDFEKSFATKWSGWTGKYYSSLDSIRNKEIPMWIKRGYLNQYGDWPFENSGIVFVKSDETIVILENITHLNHEVPLIISDEKEVEKYGIVSEIKYPFWFDICYAIWPNSSISDYLLDPNEIGDSILQAHHIPSKFPAVIKGGGDYPFYYFAGDFSDNSISVGSVNFEKIEWVSSFFYGSVAKERDSFFWKYYRPLATTIIDDYYKSLNNKR